MPLTATGPDGHDLDATDCPDSEWAEIHRRRPRVDLHCRGCGAPMHAKVSSAGSRFFAHDALNPICPSLGETPQHRELKRRIASIVRELGCTPRSRPSRQPVTTVDGAQTSSESLPTVDVSRSRSS